MKLKICGMKANTAEVAALQPDYLGFIFWEPSSRFFEGEIPELPDHIQKVGVFVDASIQEILDKMEKHNLQAVQLHGEESPEFCDELRVKSKLLGVRSSAVETSLAETNLKIIKVFSIKDDFDFSLLEPYEELCDYYLFDTQGKFPGGNGYIFDWSVLKNYASTKPYFLSGGIGLEDAEAIKEFRKRPESNYCYALDVNSRFEIEAGLKNIERLKEFKDLAVSHLFL
ncbi:phosphoribosylanthranilate isomerase [Pricia antarctica]|uniref:N-(5'-phosphoribosyl)anthranilate isomerase n=1 Tax=Pricia antarctica TaxID=641691 RepID=A0A1G7GFH5_9FLAO|nr:phosphoribosylanthranilate isomerase [Pricia antarctica]SDE86880.1 phosphoribosylanthranilate isomerase [Pricia antarctica]